jgi:outer membrane assembly lipoprotein YfiO
MRHRIQYILMGAILCYTYGCAPKSANLKRSLVPPDKTLFETGDNYLKRGQYIRSRLAFQTLINTYPESEMASEAVFAMGDSYYEEGGLDNLLQAEDEYKNFIIFYPASPKAPEAQMKIISLNERMMKGPDNDQQYSIRTLREIERFEKYYSNSDFLPIVKKLKIRVQEVLAQKDYMIGKYYGDKGNLAAALSRYQTITEKYPDFSEMDTIYFQMANILERGRKPDTAAEYYAKVVQGYPFSKVFDDAKTRLKLLGRDVPSVDTELAADNLSKTKPSEGFVPWKPITEFAKALVGSHHDVYKEAKETLAEMASNSAPKTGSAGEATADRIIDVVVEKNSEGETTSKISDPDSAADSPDKEEAKTPSTLRYAKKNTHQLREE